MLIHVKKNSWVAVGLSLVWQLGLAQAAPQITPPSQTSNPAPTPPAQGANTPNNSTEIDSSTSTALDYLFNHKAGEGTTMKAGNDVASAIADKIKAVDVLKTPGLENPEMRSRFETYLSLKEVPQARIDEYFGKMKAVSETLKAGDTITAWKLLYELGDYTDLDAGISRELAEARREFLEYRPHEERPGNRQHEVASRMRPRPFITPTSERTGPGRATGSNRGPSRARAAATPVATVSATPTRRIRRSTIRPPTRPPRKPRWTRRWPATCRASWR